MFEIREREKKTVHFESFKSTMEAYTVYLSYLKLIEQPSALILCVKTLSLLLLAEESECFICRDVGLVVEDPLRTFCDCKNLVAHHSCLLTWIKKVPSAF